ncbi:protein kinase C delta type-like [Xenopus tropicalis]|uniref:Protein kinase C delta type-like n=1 Tax=Xenopus tropicalis TaxID=8364 RepID=A0A8J1IZ05_XENTR|nr:protein kinase C delta type-like [Xenopus tropicalis]
MATGKLPFSPDGTSKEQLETIMNREPYYPERVRPELCDFIKQLLKKNVKQRLGVCANVQDHPFLSSVNWRNVKRLRLEPPLKPRIKPIDRLSNIPFPVNNISGTCMIKDITYTDPTWKDK